MRLPIALATSLIALAAPASAATVVVIDFDDLTVGTPVGTQIPTFNFSNFEVGSQSNAPSLPNFAFNSDSPATLVSQRPFTSLAFTAGAFDFFSLQVRETAAGGGAVRGSLFVEVQPGDEGEFFDYLVQLSGPARFVTISSPDFSFAWDDVTLTVIPEPATWAMLIAGFGVVGGSLRRRRAVAA
jgi:hypothetical protein